MFPPLREWCEQVVTTTAHAVDTEQTEITGVEIFRKFYDQSSGPDEQMYRPPADVVPQELCDYITDYRVLTQQCDSEFSEPETRTQRNPDTGLRWCDLRRPSDMCNARGARSQIMKHTEAGRRVTECITNKRGLVRPASWKASGILDDAAGILESIGRRHIARVRSQQAHNDNASANERDDAYIREYGRPQHFQPGAVASSNSTDAPATAGSGGAPSTGLALIGEDSVQEFSTKQERPDQEQPVQVQRMQKVPISSSEDKCHARGVKENMRLSMHQELHDGKVKMEQGGPGQLPSSSSTDIRPAVAPIVGSKKRVSSRQGNAAPKESAQACDTGNSSNALVRNPKIARGRTNERMPTGSPLATILSQKQPNGSASARASSVPGKSILRNPSKQLAASRARFQSEITTVQAPVGGGATPVHRMVSPTEETVLPTRHDQMLEI